jgi:hypothetical protein
MKEQACTNGLAPSYIVMGISLVYPIRRTVSLVTDKKGHTLVTAGGVAFKFERIFLTLEHLSKKVDVIWLSSKRRFL